MTGAVLESCGLVCRSRSSTGRAGVPAFELANAVFKFLDVGDFGCASGPSNDPDYVYSTVQVVSCDEFDLDRDGDGLDCE